MKKYPVVSLVSLSIVCISFFSFQPKPNSNSAVQRNAGESKRAPSANNEKKASPANNLASVLERGKVVYASACLSCHQADGGGVPRLNPPLAGCSWAIGDKERIIKIVLNGMTDRVPIDDDYYSNSMTPHRHLTDQQIADVLTYIRKSFGNNADPVLPAEVQKVRKNK